MSIQISGCMWMTKLRKKQIENFRKKADYIASELKTDRHIVACLGSAGLTFNNDIMEFIEFLLKEREELKLWKGPVHEK